MTALLMLAAWLGGMAAGWYLPDYGPRLLHRPAAPAARPAVRSVPAEQHPPACVCHGTGLSELGTTCPVMWSHPADQVRLVGRIPRGSNR